MELNDFIIDTLNQTQQAVTNATDGLTRDELEFQPKNDANSIGFILWHQVRAEDSMVNGMIQQKPQVWISDKWYQKLNLPEDDDGWGYTAEQVAAFPVPELKDLLEYAEAIRTRTVEYLGAIAADGLEQVIETHVFGKMTIGQIFARLLCEITQHIGQIAYLRGLQRGLNK